VLCCLEVHQDEENVVDVTALDDDFAIEQLAIELNVQHHPGICSYFGKHWCDFASPT
jgi:hypothetical protein